MNYETHALRCTHVICLTIMCMRVIRMHTSETQVRHAHVSCELQVSGLHAHK
jgi:hypothetical protein